MLSNTSPIVNERGDTSRTWASYSRSTRCVPGTFAVRPSSSMRWRTASRRKPSTPMSRSQKSATCSISRITSGDAQFRSGISEEKKP